MSRFWSSMHGMRSAIAVAVAVLVMMSGVFTVASHAASSHGRSPVMDHRGLETPSSHKMHDCAGERAVDAVDLDQTGGSSHPNHSEGRADGGCACICNPAAQLGKGDDAAADMHARSRNRPGKDAMLASITLDTDDPPIILALS